MKVREAIAAALRRDPDLLPKMTDSLRERIDQEQGPMSRVVQAAEALEPILADAFERNPTRLGRLGLKSAHVLAGLAMEDARSNRRLAHIARGSTVGIVFVDVANFTTFTAEHGDDEARELIARTTEIVHRSAKKCRGEVVKHLGDGFLLAFPSASQAVNAALHLKETIAREKARYDGFPLRLRVAVHAGEPLVEQDDLLGHDVNLTARLLDHCKPGQVVISETAKELAERRLKKATFTKRRTVKIRGLAGRVPIYAVERERATI